MSTGVGRSREELYPTTGGPCVDRIPVNPADRTRKRPAPHDGPMRIVSLIAGLAVTGLSTSAVGASLDVGLPPADGGAAVIVESAAVIGALPGPPRRVRAGDDSRLDPPVRGAPRLVNPFRASASPWGAGHRGVDLEVAVGIEVLAPASGTVSFSGVVVGRGVVTITHPDGVRSSLEPVDPLVRVGDRVTTGQAVGLVSGAPGHCAPAVCLHWGVRRGATYLDPLGLLRGFGPIVLLPIDRPG